MNQYIKYPEEVKQDRLEKELIRIKKLLKEQRLISLKEKRPKKNGKKRRENGSNTNVKKG